mmetsp:Transcript_6273/g.12724  ORF Transcript_6273/g.12724 Transcript_6273/m.12724 type:complete len:206 (-) Transcript_6273:3-620(-)
MQMAWPARCGPGLPGARRMAAPGGARGSHGTGRRRVLQHLRCSLQMVDRMLVGGLEGAADAIPGDFARDMAAVPRDRLRGVGLGLEVSCCAGTRLEARHELAGAAAAAGAEDALRRRGRLARPRLVLELVVRAAGRIRAPPTLLWRMLQRRILRHCLALVERRRAQLLHQLSLRHFRLRLFPRHGDSQARNGQLVGVCPGPELSP